MHFYCLAVIRQPFTLIFLFHHSWQKNQNSDWKCIKQRKTCNAHAQWHKFSLFHNLRIVINQAVWYGTVSEIMLKVVRLMKHIIIDVSNGLHSDVPITWFLWMNQELIILSIASYYDDLKQKNDHSIFVSSKMINLFSTLFLFHICMLAYFIVDNYDKYPFCIISRMIREGRWNVSL